MATATKSAMGRKREMAMKAREMVTAMKRATVRVLRLMAMATRVVGNKEGNGKGGKGDGNTDKEGYGNGDYTVMATARVAGDKEGNCKGGKSNDNSNNEGNGKEEGGCEGGKSNGDGNKEGSGNKECDREGGKRDGNSSKNGRQLRVQWPGQQG